MRVRVWLALAAAGAGITTAAVVGGGRRRPTSRHCQSSRASTCSSSPSTTSTGTSSRRPASAAGSGTGANAGGAEYLATTSPTSRRPTPNTIVVSAGDLIGASPLLSGLFHDEPTIEAMNEIGLDLNAVGNHEFDEGVDRAAAHAERRLPPGRRLPGRRRLRRRRLRVPRRQRRQRRDRRDPVPAATRSRTFDGAKVAFIGMTLEGTPNIVSAGGHPGLDVPRRGRHRQRASSPS